MEYTLFTQEQAVYAVDNCGADWKEQAAGMLEYYIEYHDELSREEVLQKLADDGYTDEEISYAVEQMNF